MFNFILRAWIILVRPPHRSLQAKMQARFRAAISSLHKMKHNENVSNPSVGILLMGSSTLRRMQTKKFVEAAPPCAEALVRRCVINCAVDWSGTAELSDTLRLTGHAIPAALVICYSGVNDVDHLADECILENVREVVKVVRDKEMTQFDCFVYIGIIESNIQTNLGRSEHIAELNESIRCLMKDVPGVLFFDPNRRGMLSPEDYGIDGMHMNERGYTNFIRGLWTFIESAMEE
jgi:hypothetical protein